MNNSTASLDHHEDSMPIPNAFKLVFSVAVSIVLLVSVIGNILVIFSFQITPHLRKSTNYYITSMAASDLLYVTASWMLCMYVNTRLYVFGDSVSSFQCKLGMYLRTVSYGVSVESLVVISVDRFIATVFPMKATMITRRIRAVFIALTWIIPMGGVAPYFYFTRKAQETDGPYLCIIGRINIIYMILGFVLFYLIPLIVIIILNTRIMKSLARKDPVIQGNVDVSTTRRNQSQRIMKVLISIMSFFFICWTLNYLSIFLITFFQNVLRRYIQEILVTMCNSVLPLVSTAFNPVILFTHSTNYRQALTNCVRVAVDKCCSSLPCFTVPEQVARAENLELPEEQ